MSLKLLIPDIGDFDNVEIIEILVKKGQKINKNDPVVTLESDKSSVEVPSNYEGKVESINVKIGPIAIKIPAVEDCICCSDQLIK